MKTRRLALLGAVAAIAIGGGYGLIDERETAPPTARALARTHYLRALDHALAFDRPAFRAAVLASVAADPTYLPPYLDFNLVLGRAGTAEGRRLVHAANRVPDARLRRCLVAAAEHATVERLDVGVTPSTGDTDAALCESWFHFNTAGGAEPLPAREQIEAALRRYPESYSFATLPLQALISGNRYPELAKQVRRLLRSDLHPLVRATLLAYQAQSLHLRSRHAAALRTEQAGWRFAREAGPIALLRYAQHLPGPGHDRGRFEAQTADLRDHADSVNAAVERAVAAIFGAAPREVQLWEQAHLAVRQLDVGELAAADAAFTRLLPQVEATGDTVLLAFLHMRRGRARVKLGETAVAEFDLFRARELAAGRDSIIALEAEHNLLHLYESLERDADAEAAGLRFIERASRSAARGVRIVSHHDLALFYQRRGRTAEATRQYRAMIAAVDRFRSYYAFVGEYYELIGDWDRAREYYLRTQRDSDTYRAYAGLARIALAQGRHDEALEHARAHDRFIESVAGPEAVPLVPTILIGGSDLPRAAAVIDSLRARASDAGAVARWARLTAHRAELAWRLQSPERAEQLADSAVAAARSVGLDEIEMRAGALAALARLARGACCAEDADDPLEQLRRIARHAHATAFVSLEQEVLTWLGDALALAGRLGPALQAYARGADLADSIAASMHSDPARAGYRATTAGISNRALAAIAQAAPANAPELFTAWSIRRKARELTTSRVSPAETSALRRLRTQLATNTAVIDYIALDSTLLALVITSDAAVIRRLPISRARLRVLALRLRAQLDARVGSSVDLRRIRLDIAAAHELYRALLEPLEQDWPGRTRLVIAGDAELHALPFDALVTDAGGRTYVLDRYRITMLPSLARALRLRPPARSAMQHVLAVGAADVPGAAAEIDAIARAFPDRAIRLTGPAATRDSVVARLQPGITLHFAVHAYPNTIDPEHASLKLEPGPDDTGELRAFEIARWPLRDSFVVLSACETGVGRVFEAEGVLSLARAFFAAGASDVVATLWPVSGSAADLMTYFYAGLAAGTAPGEAMHRAKLRLRHDPSTRNPFHWAAFQLIAGSL